MSSWSAKRKIIYLSIISAFLFVVIGVPSFFILYQKPTCFDFKKNGDELGLDCGGSCQLLCSFEATDPGVLWSRSFKVVPGIYSAVAYIQNHNISSESINVPYIFKLYDNKNTLLATREGVAYIPQNKIFAVFEPNIKVDQRIPIRTTFEITETPVWIKNTDAVPDFSVTQKSLTGEDKTPRVDATIENHSLIPFSNIEVITIVYDGKDNAIGASRTYIDTLAKDQAADIVFTWPNTFDTQSNICKVPADVMMVIDRSGSMASDGDNPPQPLTDVKNAAILFINQLGKNDKAGVVSYADDASQPIDHDLSVDFKAIKDSIQSIVIGTNGLQQTNIADGLQKALEEFSTERHNDSARKIIIALTDGIPTRPVKVGDEEYPETTAKNVADEIKKSEVQLYTVGLGNKINPTFLESLASGPEYYFSASSSENLGTIYKQIATSICKDSPTSVDILIVVQKSTR
ncbi:VWA domain-containing protein [Candidatus Parcubacteria bacterium]|nr:VWA domain-containing protein [Candidatus Parcubacteria bacterium]